MRNFQRSQISLLCNKTVVATILLLLLRSAIAGQLHFLAIGDAGSGTEIQKDVAEAMCRYTEEMKATNLVKFVLVLGDNFYETGVTNITDPQWDQKFEAMYDKKRLPIPFIAVLGNHDWKTNSPDVEIEYSRAHPESRWQMDGHWFKRHFLVDGSADADFFFIDCQLWNTNDTHVAQYPDKHMGDKQLRWLDGELQRSQAVWKFVVGHHPLFSNGQHGHDIDILDLRRKLLPLFNRYKVDAYITGHDHDLQRIEAPDSRTLFIVSGAAGKLRTRKFDDWKPFYQSTPGFAAIQLSRSEMRGQFYDANGKILDQWHRTPLSLEHGHTQ